MGFPLGTVVLGCAAMLWYFQRDPGGRPTGRQGYRAKEPTAASLEDYARKLSGPTLGIRGAEDENSRRGLKATMSLVEGALGETNMGYTPESETFQAGGQVWRNIWADNTGQRNPTEIVEIRVSLDRGAPGPPRPAESLGLATALELAHALAGTGNRRTIRFLFLGNNAFPGAHLPRGREIYAARMGNRAFKTVAVIDLDGRDLDPARYVRPDGSVDYASLLDGLANLRESIGRFANQ